MFYHFFFSFKLCIYMPRSRNSSPRSKNSSGVYRPKYKKCALLACVAQPTYPIPARSGTDTAGRGAFEPPPEDGARTKLFHREFQFRESHTEAETEKTPDRISRKKNDHIYIYIYFLTLLLYSFWTSRGHRCRPFFPPVLAFNFYRA